ncbi:MAG TPA: PspC domain-containing protein [Candidatus Deferrimicrobium sp.]|nr:PspC domain-containing protein [Candidatus Kapabacteria bacterium]HLP61127.1 PspC domain-containing protein [Candidatus Deferrimicrobium sp.]
MKRLYRSRTNKVFAGICGGLGEYFNVDPVLVRIIAVFLTLFMGFPLLVYLVAIFVIPQEPLGVVNTTDTTSQPFAAQTTPGTIVKQGMPMEEHIKILGILYLAFSAVGLIAAFALFIIISGGGLISGDNTVITITTVVGTAIAGILFILSIPGIIGGMGLLKKQNWARILVLVLGIIDLINIPFGTALGIYTIWVLTNKETEALFNKI